VLDNFQTVNEVVQAHKHGRFRLVAVTAPALGNTETLGSHLAVEDPTGDSAIIEYVAGKLVVHHGPEYNIMTNDPPLDEMLRRMKKYKAFGGTRALPGESMEGEARFARLAAYQKLLPEPKNSTEALAAALSLLRIAQIPFRDPKKDTDSEDEATAAALSLLRMVQSPFRDPKRDPDSDPEALWRGCQTNWVSAADLTHKIYYIDSLLVLSMGWVELKDLNFGVGVPILFADPHAPKQGGDLAKRLNQWQAPPK
jgi:choloylglycine hydrolase